MALIEDEALLLRIGLDPNESSDEEDINHVLIADAAIVNNEGGFRGNMILNHVLELLDREGRTCVEMYVEHIVPLYSDETFISHFRMKRTLVQDIVNKFQATEEFASIQGNGGLQPVSPDKHILAFLWFVGHQTASYRDVADRFDMTTSTLHHVISRVIKFLLSLAPVVIRYPTMEEKEETKNHYMQTKGLPDVVGSVDGCHIRLDQPAEDKDAYVNRKHYFSVHLQGTVNEKRKFIDVLIGFPGSVHDARVFANSPLADDLPTLCEGGGLVLGDSAYPCLPQLITPYKDNGHLTRAQRNFNRVHSSCRITVEHAFGCLKQRFRQLYHLKLRDMQRVVQLIHACCVLHNLADEVDLSHLEPLEHDDYPDPNAMEVLGNRHRAGELMPIEEDGEPNDTVRGRDVRDELCRQLAIRQ